MASNPLIEALLRRAGRGVSRINTMSDARQTALQPFAGRAAATYGQARGNEAALGGAVSNSLTQQGQQLGADIGGKLQGIQAPGQAVQQFGAGTATTGAQAGAAVGALSSADLQRLQGQGTAEEIYASALPRLAALAGEQERRGFLQQAKEELTDKLVELQVQQARQAVEDARYRREWAYKVQQDADAEADEDRRWRYDVGRDRKADARSARALGLAARQTAVDEAQDWARVGISQGHLATSQGNLAERQRAAGERERLAREKEKRLSAGGGSKKERTDYFYATRKDAFKAALAMRSAKPRFKGDKSGVVDKRTAYQRLFAEFGTLLLGRGYRRKAIEEMLRRALAAAGY